MVVRGRFLDEMDYLAPREDERLRVAEVEKLLDRGRKGILALALAALAEHLEACRSLPRPEPARAATGDERCSPLPSGGGEPSAEEIRVVAIKVTELWGPLGIGSGRSHEQKAEQLIRALDEYRARKAKP